jgi:nitrogen fixation/metabolism regulation signal transduction histidine kinase
MEAFHLYAADAAKRSVTRTLRIALIVSVVLGAILLALLAVASGNDRMLESHYPVLLGLNIVIGVALAALALELARRLVQRYRAGLFGTRLMARLALSFVVMTLVPVLLIYLVAVQFLGRSVESWFDVPMERALESGLNLGRASLDSMLVDLESKGRTMASELSELPERQWPATLDRLRERAGVQEALVITGTGRILFASGGRFAQLVPDLPPAPALRQARMTRHYSGVEGGDPSASGAGGDPQRQLKLRVIDTVRFGSHLLDDIRMLQLVQPVPPSLAENAEAVQQGYRDYQQLSLSRVGLKRIFRITMTVTLLLTVFSAIAASFLLAGWLTGPLSMLAAGTRAVAEGDFRPVKDYAGRDELGVLTQSFNVMTRQLEEARALVERNQQELQRANARLASVLSNLTAGVLVFDDGMRVSLANVGVERILGVEAGGLVGHRLAEVPRLQEAAAEIESAFEALGDEHDRGWQRQLVLARQGHAGSEAGRDNGAAQTLLVRGARLPAPQDGYLMVVDDVSDVVSAQRAVAWSEVARRLAHEIKNPLTPIQLAAERMQHKLAPKLQPADAEMLARGAQTIVSQVGALKVMVDEFRDYARLPAARLAPLDLDGLVSEVIALYAPLEAAGALRVDHGGPVPRILGDASQLRQLIHNLVKNAIEATERQPQRSIEVAVEPVRRAGELVAARLAVRDNGSGFAPGTLARAFEPYVTTKPRGTGLGLAIVRKIVDEHGAQIELANRTDAAGAIIGAAVNVLFTKVAKNDDNCSIDTTLAAGTSPGDPHGRTTTS